MKKLMILTCVLFAADQLSKYIIVSLVPYGAIIKVIPFFNFFNITNVHNTGAAFSILQGNNLAFTILIVVVLSAAGLWFYFNANKITLLQKYAFCLIFAGGLGNLTDRIFRGAVVDFLDFGINSLRWPAFNVADSCICIAAGLIVIDILKTNNNLQITNNK
ncbi:MAG: signal peptidase II [Endomicrobia bacterium]|nr:signal peptidase II [Endomicrobiia bacterium]